MRYLSNNTVFKQNQRFYQILFVAAVILTALWQLTTFHHTLKWDAIDITLPWRYFVSDAIYQNGVLPWWNPFQHHGFAQGLSLESWYPLAHLLGFLRPYDLYSLNIEYLLHLLIASFGFYRLARKMGITHQGALWGALVFPLTGFFIGNSQHTGWIVSGAWTPHVISSFLGWLEKQDLKNTLLLVLLSFLLVSGGYIAYTIVTVYILIILWSIHLLKKRKSKTALHSFLWMSARLIVVLTMALSLLLVAMWTLKSQIDRGAGLDHTAILKGSLYFKHLISLIVPFSTLKGSFEFWQADQSLMNLYVGIPALILLILSLKRLNQSFYRIGWLAVIFSLAMAFAVELPLRKWMNILPFFDLFRLPSLFRYYTILSLILMAAKMIGEHPYPNDDASRFRTMFNRFAILLLTFFVLFVLGLIIRKPDDLAKVISLDPESISQAFIFQLAIHILLLSAFLIGVKVLGQRFTFYKLLMLYSAMDVMIATQLNCRVSVLSEQPFKPMQECIHQLPKGFPAPSLWDVLGSNADKSLQMGAIYRNTNTLFKRFGWNGYTPFQYQQYIDFEKTPFFNKALGLPPVFLTQSLIRSDTQSFYVSEPLLNLTGDQLQIVKFDLNQLIVKTHMPIRSGLVYNQNLVRGWKAEIDGKPTEPVPVDHSLLGVHLTPGQHLVKLRYDAGNLINAFWISLVSMGLVVIFYFWIYRTSFPHQIFLATLLILLLTKFFHWYRKPVPEFPIETKMLINRIDALNVPDSNFFIADRLLDKGDLNRFDQILANNRSALTFFDRPLCNPQRHLFADHFHKMYKSIEENTFGIYNIDRGFNEVDSIVFMTNTGFEAPVSDWQDQGVSIGYEDNNLYQSLKGRKYSATLRLDLDKVNWGNVDEISIAFQYRNAEPIESSLVFVLEGHEHQDLIWKSQDLADHQDETWRIKKWHQVKDPTWNEARFLIVYVWNKMESNMEIDNLEVRLLSHGKDK